MKLRAPAHPLITVDPYFSVWCNHDCLNDDQTVHWTGAYNTLDGIVTVDGESFRFMGDCDKYEKIRQTDLDITALTTNYTFKNEKIKLNIAFFTPLFPDDLYRLSRPVSYMNASYEALDGTAHTVEISVSASEELCLDKKGQSEVNVLNEKTPSGMPVIGMGNKVQVPLNRDGDDLRIDWGFFFMCGGENSVTDSFMLDGMTFVRTEFGLKENAVSTMVFAYDDIQSLEYFGKPVKAYWHKKGISIFGAIEEALGESDKIYSECLARGEKLFADASVIGGEKYAELLCLAFRQVIAAHKLAVTEDGENIFISKECFSNGCAATVDVTYPSSPFFILYNTELLKGMLRPIFKFAASDVWDFDFAPHDVGTYPIVNGQRYGWKRQTREEYLKVQMPVEECGNMIICVANICIKDGSTEFADKYMPFLSQWVKYLIDYGEDPANQLCTDDFAGHLAHNCNLSLKAIMGVAGYSIILKMQGNPEHDEYMQKARAMAESWMKRATNGDGSFRLAFDRPGTFSMKYNIVWDKIWGTGLFPDFLYFSEFASNLRHVNVYGMPLDNRRAYTKSDWLVWTACLAPTKEEFASFIEPLWNAYNVSLSRVPLTDWYDTNTAVKIGFQNRTVQGGLFIKLM